jgi:hypothetical protein
MDRQLNHGIDTEAIFADSRADTQRFFSEAMFDLSLAYGSEYVHQRPQLVAAYVQARVAGYQTEILLQCAEAGLTKEIRMALAKETEADIPAST